MKNEFIPYEQALALKNLGFDEPCFGTASDIDITLRSDIKMPLYQQAFRWFREKHGLRHFIEFDDGHYNPVVQSSLVYHCDTYEEAELACLNRFIILITK